MFYFSTKKLIKHQLQRKVIVLRVDARTTLINTNIAKEFLWLGPRSFLNKESQMYSTRDLSHVDFHI